MEGGVCVLARVVRLVKTHEFSEDESELDTSEFIKMEATYRGDGSNKKECNLILKFNFTGNEGAGGKYRALRHSS